MDDRIDENKVLFIPAYIKGYELQSIGWEPEDCIIILKHLDDVNYAYNIDRKSFGSVLTRNIIVSPQFSISKLPEGLLTDSEKQFIINTDNALSFERLLKFAYTSGGR